ncbi:17512_t:CDS:2 [Acaulospora morrowiae]|uniref:17512_t:CDS:1 n=1 Tax=Acaulospora morrowiae TaxID=94023 RepID=A0A9N8YU09_9GLOM|nr:17512_t:CDS:2 [Acaulospora morrowiae]
MEHNSERIEGSWNIHYTPRATTRYPEPQNKNVPAEETADDYPNKTQEGECVIMDAPAELPDEASRPIYDKAPMKADAGMLNQEDSDMMTKQTNGTLELANEITTAQKDTDKYLGETTEYFNDDKAVSNQGGMGKDDVNKIVSQLEETDKIVIQDPRGKKNQRTIRNQPIECYEGREMRPKDEPRQHINKKAQNGSDRYLEKEIPFVYDNPPNEPYSTRKRLSITNDLDFGEGYELTCGNLIGISMKEEESAQITSDRKNDKSISCSNTPLEASNP